MAKNTYPKMNQKYKDKWVKTLRSREYKQTKSSLQNEYGFCCLGVLCHSNKDVYDPSDSFLPVDLEDKYGLSFETQEILAELNDEKGLKFNKIANWIEKNL